MQTTESVVIKLKPPNAWKREYLEWFQDTFGQAVQLGLDFARELQTSNRGRLHQSTYYPARQLGLPGDYARMAVNTAVAMARSWFGQQKSNLQASFPTVNGKNGIGLGTASYKLVDNDGRWVLRVSTGQRGHYLWLPLCVPQKFSQRLESVKGDAKLFQRGSDWYVMLPVRILTPTGSSGEPTFIGVDLGIVRHATVAVENRVRFFNGKPARHKREHLADLRRRYQRKGRMDRVKRGKGKERRWMRDVNHKISRQIVDLALEYEHPVICLEALDGIRDRVRSSKRFNRMVSSWAFRQLADFITYKAEREGGAVLFVDPRKTSQTCSKCGYESRHNRRTQGTFRCHSCGHEVNADLNAARNIAARGPAAYGQEPPDTAPGDAETETVGSRSDVVSDRADVSHG